MARLTLSRLPGRPSMPRAGGAGALPRRRLATIAAVLLAVLGVVLLLSWVDAADARAQAGQKLVPVLVVDEQVAAGTTGSDVAGSVTTKQVPARLVAAGALSSLSAVSDQVTTAVLLPGEQLVTGRFEDPGKQLPAGTVATPAGDVTVSIDLAAERAVGGTLTAGDLVGLQITNQDNADGGVTSFSVWNVFHKVLVTHVTDAASTSGTSSTVTVTFALPADVAAQVVLGMQAKDAIWLTLEQSAGNSAGTATQTSTQTAAAQTTTATLGDHK